MKHQAKKYKLGRDTKHRKSLRYNLARSLFLNEKIVTTTAKAKSIISFVDKLITLGKNDDLNAYKAILSNMRSDEIVAKKIIEYSNKFKNRDGGYLRIVKVGQRQGDSAHLSCLQFV